MVHIHHFILFMELNTVSAHGVQNHLDYLGALQQLLHQQILCQLFRDSENYHSLMEIILGSRFSLQKKRGG